MNEQKISNAYLDSMCTWEVISAFHHPEPKLCYPWARQTAAEITYILLSTNHIRMAPPSRKVKPARGLQTHLTKRLGYDVVAHEHQPPNLGKSMWELTRDLASQERKELSKAFKKVFASENFENIDGWLKIARMHALVEHRKMFGSLFDKELIPEMAPILKDFSRRHLDSLWKKSADEVTVERISRGLEDRLWDELCRPFVLAAIIRGRYHYQIASTAQVYQHPMRSWLPPGLADPEAIKAEIFVSNTRRYLANIVLGHAYSASWRLSEPETNAKRRIARWAGSIIAIRKKSLDTGFHLDEECDGEEAEKRAVEFVAKEFALRLRTVGFYLDFVTAAATGGVVNALSSFILKDPMWSFLAGAGTTVGTKIVQTRFALPSFHKRDLRKLAKAGPGRIEPIWTPNPLT